MTRDLMTDAVLREFLLDRVDDAEREQIENLFLTDSQARDRVLSAEQDLIEDYLEGSLTDADKERFLALHAKTEEQRENLRNTRTIKDWALAEGLLTQAAQARSSQDKHQVTAWPRLGARLGVKPIYLFAFAVTVVVAIVLALLWVNGRIAQRKHLALEQELAQLNSPTNLRETPPQMISLELRPGAVRSVEAQPEVEASSESQIVELQLQWTHKERYSTYKAEVNRVGDNESFTIGNLQPANNEVPQANDKPPTIRLRLPAHILPRGHYLIRLTGISTNGTAGPTEEYNFAVTS